MISSEKETLCLLKVFFLMKSEDKKNQQNLEGVRLKHKSLRILEISSQLVLRSIFYATAEDAIKVPQVQHMEI
jgi:hypothetical protein